MIVRYFEQREDGGEFADLIQAVRPSAPTDFAAGIAPPFAACCAISMNWRAHSDVRRGRKRAADSDQAICQGRWRLVGFNLDRKFSDVVDGLVIVDLRRTEPSVLERYMGKLGHSRFRNFTTSIN